PAAVLQKLRKKERHLVARQRKLVGPREVVPLRGMRRHVDRTRNELVPAIRKRSAFGRDSAEECVEQEECASDLPAAKVSRGGAAPGVAAEPRSSGCDDSCDLFDCRCGNAGFFRCEFEGV